ncbi:hypothetical protein XENTR_v10010052 [Xenopus tropicalis]|nr:hypothetical protein XENTR_v10010052 [Xenopus tropicalis]
MCKWNAFCQYSAPLPSSSFPVSLLLISCSLYYISPSPMSLRLLLLLPCSSVVSPLSLSLLPYCPHSSFYTLHPSPTTLSLSPF